MANAKGQKRAAFPEVTYEAWAQRVERESRAPAQKLETELEGGRVMRALYFEPTPDVVPVGATEPRGAPALWTRVATADPASANRQLLADLAGGASGLILDADHPRRVITSKAELDRLLAAVQLDLIQLQLVPSARSKQLATWLTEIAHERGVRSPELRLHAGADPCSAWAQAGGPPASIDAGFDDAAWMIKTLSPAWPSLRVLGVSTVPYHEAGASPDFELACLAGSLADTLRALEERGIPPELAAAQITITLTADADFMLGLTKLRACKRIVHRMLEASGVSEAHRHPPILVTTRRRMLTQFEPFVNAPRGTAVSFVALVGGADFVEVAPYDERSCSENSETGRRLALNTTHVLRDEAQLARVLDPAAGAYFFEAETRALSEAAWASFKRMESEGGFTAALCEGRVGMVSNAHAFEQLRAISHRTRPLTGISEFADPSAISAVAQPVPLKTATVPKLEPVHWAEPFEKLRRAAEAYRAKHGKLPEVQVLTLGERSEHAARTAWVTNLLAAGGLIATSESRPVIVVSGADERYENEAALLAQKLRARGDIRHLSLAGKPKHETQYRLAGFDAFVFRGEDVSAYLAQLHAALETGA